MYRDQTSTLAKLLHFSITNLHELAHMWFVNLVPINWWNNPWLNESYATFVYFLAMGFFQESLISITMLGKFLKKKFWGDSTDKISLKHSFCCEITNTDEADLLFDGISYGKRSAFLK